MNRAEALDDVKQKITKDRNATHGEPVPQLARASAIKNAIGHRQNPHLNATEIEAIDNIATKLSRMAMGDPSHSDHMLDIIGYAAIAIESRHKVKETFAINDIVIVKQSSPYSGKRGKISEVLPDDRNPYFVAFEDGSALYYSADHLIHG